MQQSPDITETRDRVSFTINEIAARHDLSRATIYREIARGRLKAVKVGSIVRITGEAERAWLAALPAVRSGAAA